MSERAALLGCATTAATTSSSSVSAASVSAAYGQPSDIERGGGDDGVRGERSARGAAVDVRASSSSSSFEGMVGEHARRAYDRHVRGGLSGAATCVLALGAFAAAFARGRAAVSSGARAAAIGASLGDGARETANLNAFQGSSFEGSVGVALNGWLQLEDWFYANGETSIVDAELGASPIGAVFPPVFPSSESLGFKWSSEGELTMKLVDKLGEEAAIEAVSAHRVDFLSNGDLEKIKGLGYQTLRVPITWAAFQGTDENPTVLVRDPVYKDRALVSLDKNQLTEVLRTVHRVTGSTILIDMHNMPGGSSAGTYNGVFPHKPAFWDDEKTQMMGLHSARKMLEWYNDLAEDDKDFVDGFTLLNEPAHLLPEKKEIMLKWMAKAIYMYREIVVRPREAMKRPVPKLYVNLMNTAGIAQNEYGKLMASWFDETELNDWAVLDLHFYLAWGNTGCEEGCAFKCSDPIKKIAESVRSSAAAFIGGIKRPAETYGVKRFSIGEWSLATHRDSTKGCSDAVVSQTVYKSQMKAFNAMGVKNFFWGWKMPSAGSHQDFWSMDMFQSRMAVQLGEHNVVAPSLGSTQSDNMRLDDTTMSVVSSLLDDAHVGVDAAAVDNAAQPVQPVVAPQPVQPVVVAQPVQPVVAAQPVQPVVVAQPVQPVVAAQPVQPVVVAQPVQPVVAAQPQQPVAAQVSSKFAPVHVELNPGQAQVATSVPKPEQTQPALALPVTAAADKPVVYASQRHDGSFWATAYGMDALKPPSVHKNAFMIEDSKDIDETEYYEEPREVIAERTGRALPTYADDAKDHLHQHRSTYSMHDAKHMKADKVSYDLFSSAGENHDDGMMDINNDVDEDVDIDLSNLIVDTDGFDARSPGRASSAEDSAERVPSKSSSHSKHKKSHSDDGEYDDIDDVIAADDDKDASWVSLAGRDLEGEESSRFSKSSSRGGRKSASRRRDDDDDDDDDDE